MTDVMLANRDYSLVIAKTDYEMGKAPPHFQERWTDAQAAIVSLAQTCNLFDPDGITIYIASQTATTGTFQKYPNIAPDQINRLFTENPPPHTVDVAAGLQLALDEYFANKAANQAKANGAIILVLLDAEPRNHQDLIHAIVEATEKIDRDEELGIGFVQVGDDLIARGFLNSLDQDLQTQAGAKFDIVHTRVLSKIEPACLTTFLTDIIRS